MAGLIQFSWDDGVKKMLSMKTLRVAVVTMGSALLLGPGIAAADTFNLDATGRAMDPRTPPQVFATETLATKDTIGRRDFYQINNPEDTDGDLRVAVRTARRIEMGEDLWLRLELHGGAVFGAGVAPDGEPNTAPALGGPGAVTYDDRTSGGDGAQGDTYIVFKVPTTGDLGIGDDIYVDISDDISVPAGSGNYSASITAHTLADDAIGDVGVGSVGAFGGGAMIMRVVDGLAVRLIARRAVAEVEVGFLWFDTGVASPPVTGQGKIGSVNVGASRLPDGATLYSAIDGTVIASPAIPEGVGVDDQVIDAVAAVSDLSSLVVANGVHITVEGDLSIGAFSFIDDVLGAASASTAPCVGATASENNPDRGNLTDEEEMLLVSADGEVSAAAIGYSGARMTGAQTLCVNVDVMGPATNMSSIPSGTYEATVMIQPPDVTDPRDFIEAKSGLLGRVTRNGTSVNVAYLTVSDKYNQRLIVANRGNTPARFEVGEFVTEDGTTVALSAAAEAAKAAGLNVIPPGGQLVMRVDQLLTFSGDRNRAGATVSVNAKPYNIQVATTQVNLDDGSTDTVVYMSNEGAAAGL